MKLPLASMRLIAVSAFAAVGATALFPSAALAQQEEVDLYAENAWVLDQINAEAAWETTRGEGITVAVVDTGIAEEHPFLENKNILDGYTAMDSDDGDDGRRDTDGHGTAVSAAVLYAAPEATIMPVRVNSDSSDSGDFGAGAGPLDFEGIQWAADNGADVIVLPWGQPGFSDTSDLASAIQYAIDKGAVVMAAAGNDPESEDADVPARYEGVVGVSGTARNGDAASFSTTGPGVALAGPGDTMVFPKPQLWDFGEEDLYFEAAGTSVSVGVVGGVAALVKAAHPELDASNVIQRLIATADDGGAGRTDELGFGFVDADQAVHAEGIETVEENPLGYPLGEPGASGADAEGDSEPSEESSSPESDQTAQAASDEERNLVPVIVIAAAVVLLAAGIVVWLVLRHRSRPSTQPWQ